MVHSSIILRLRNVNFFATYVPYILTAKLYKDAVSRYFPAISYHRQKMNSLISRNPHTLCEHLDVLLESILNNVNKHENVVTILKTAQMTTFLTILSS